jgi:hypothetical protein
MAGNSRLRDGGAFTSVGKHGPLEKGTLKMKTPVISKMIAGLALANAPATLVASTHGLCH